MVCCVVAEHFMDVTGAGELYQKALANQRQRGYVFSHSFTLLNFFQEKAHSYKKTAQKISLRSLQLFMMLLCMLR
jgi:hypothetical protein